MFDKKKFLEKAEKWLQDEGWKNRKDMMDQLIGQFRLEEFPYKPQYLIERNGTFFIVNFFQKGGYSYSKKLGGQATGLDYYKYKFLNALQSITGIQAGLIMHNETTDKFCFRQLDQIKNPVIYFKGMGCYAHELKKKDIEYNCFKCFKQCPHITDECLHRRKPERKKKRRREMAMWNINEFADNLIIQHKLF